MLAVVSMLKVLTKQRICKNDVYVGGKSRQHKDPESVEGK